MSDCHSEILSKLRSDCVERMDELFRAAARVERALRARSERIGTTRSTSES
jgi:hypothetical protein